MLEELKMKVYLANLELPKKQLVKLTWGNVSAIDRQRGVIAIKPSGVSYERMKPEDMVLVDMEGKVVEGRYSPSSDTPTHLALYQGFPKIGGVVHTHSTFATAFAQACTPILPLGTTHADCFFGSVPCTRALTEAEVEDGYEANTGKVILERFRQLDEEAVPAVLVANHGSFAWGKNAQEAVEHGVVLEEIAKMALLTQVVRPGQAGIASYLLQKHYCRKHGDGAYYGQKGERE